MTFEEIIEREFRKAVKAPDESSVIVDMSEPEEILVTYEGETYFCDCDSDEVFLFIDKKGNELVIPIPKDWFDTTTTRK